MPQRTSQPIRIATRIAAFVALSLFLLIPSGFFFLKYNAAAATVITTARFKTEIVSALIVASPDTWQFQEHRLKELLSRNPAILPGEAARLLDLDGKEIARAGGVLASPVLTRTSGIFDSGRQVGRIEMRISLREIVLQSLVAALLSGCMGLLVFLALRFVPAKALDRALTALRQEKERAEVTLRSIGDAVITTDAKGIVEYLNPVAEKMTGWSNDEAHARPLTDIFKLVNESTGQPVTNPLEAALTENRIVPLSNHTVMVLRDGRTVPIDDSAAPILDDYGTLTGGVLVFHDVSASRKMTSELTWQATHDALTGLTNRKEFDRLISEAVQSARIENKHHALCYIDLDQFKVVNDTCGHAAGDELLKQISTALQSRVRESDNLSRLGGDEFGLLLLGCPLTRAHHVANEMLDAIRNIRFAWGNDIFATAASIGVVAISPLSKSGQQVLSSADSACYSAKEAGRNRAHVYRYDDQDVDTRREEMSWVSRITHALEQQQFRLYFQPYQSLSPHHPAVPHIELLIRMLDDERKIIPPGAFIPAAERYNLATAIDRWVVTTAFRHHAEMAARFGNNLVASINISGQSFAEEKFDDFVIEQARHHGITPGAFCLEITETSAIRNLPLATAFIKKLRGVGFKFALDDFGAGMSSFGYLKNLPIDYLKIDGGLVREIVGNPVNRSMVKAINDIGKVMNLQTIAEFAEDAMIIDALREIGVNFAQGYGVAKPAPLLEALARQPA